MKKNDYCAALAPAVPLTAQAQSPSSGGFLCLPRSGRNWVFNISLRRRSTSAFLQRLHHLDTFPITRSFARCRGRLRFIGLAWNSKAPTVKITAPEGWGGFTAVPAQFNQAQLMGNLYYDISCPDSIVP